MIHKIAQKHTVERPTGECDASGHSTTRTLIKRAEAGPKQAKHPTLGEASQVEERGWARPPFFNVAVLHMSSSATSILKMLPKLELKSNAILRNTSVN